MKWARNLTHVREVIITYQILFEILVTRDR